MTGVQTCALPISFLYSDSCASHYAVKTRHGRIAIDWEYKGGVFKAEIQKPAKVYGVLSVLGKNVEICGDRTTVVI